MASGLDPDKEGKTVWAVRPAAADARWDRVGIAADEQTVYIPASDCRARECAGGLFALSAPTGEQLWSTPTPKGTSRKARRQDGRGCIGAQSAPVSAIPGVVFAGSVDGHFRAYSTRDGQLLWRTTPRASSRP